MSSVLRQSSRRSSERRERLVDARPSDAPNRSACSSMPRSLRAPVVAVLALAPNSERDLARDPSAVSGPSRLAPPPKRAAYNL